MTWDPLIEIPKRLQMAVLGAAFCPGHDDDSPSLSVGKGRDGRILLSCHRTPPCSILDILAAIGLEKRHLFPSNGTSAKPPVAPVNLKPSTSPKPPKLMPREVSVEACEICDERAVPVVVQLRIGLDNGGKKFSYARPCDKSGKRVRLKDLSLTPADLPLWGSELLRRHSDKPVIVCEGVKAAKAVRKADAAKVFVTLAAIAGAGVLPAFHVLGPLRDRDLILWADADDPGRKLMNDIAAWSPARSVRFVRIPNVSDGYDAADFFADGHTLKEMIDHVERE